MTFSAHMVLCSKPPYSLNLADRQKSNSGGIVIYLLTWYGALIACPDYHTFHKIWLKLDEKCGSSRLLKILTSDVLQNEPNNPKLNSQNRAWKVLNIRFLGAQVPILHSFRSTISRFQDIAHLEIFLLTPMWKFQSFTFFSNVVNYHAK